MTLRARSSPSRIRRISGLSANTIYSFNKAGHDVQLTDGSLLLRGAKGSGGGNIRTDPYGRVTGTTLIFEDKESGLVETLTPGNYTATVRGVGGATGVAVVEVYALKN